MVRTLSNNPLAVRVAAVVLFSVYMATLAATACAQSTRRDIEVSIKSEHLQGPQQVIVHLPQDYASSSDRYPVVYLLDGEEFSLAIGGMADWLAECLRTPKVIVVSIPNRDFTVRMLRFTTPWTAKDMSDAFQGMRQMGGGAEKFLALLRNEMVPYIDRNYRTYPYRVLLGHSLGALFALYAFAQPGDIFSCIVSVSPALSWNKGEPYRWLRDSLKREGHKALFLAMGGDEAYDALAFSRAVDILKAKAGPIRWKSIVFPDADHGTVAIPALQAGLEFSFPGWRLPGTIYEEGIDSVVNYYQKLSNDYGFHVPLPGRELGQLGNAALSANRGEEAIKVYERAVEEYPDSPSFHDGLGAAYEKSGQLKRAAGMYRQAVNLGEKYQSGLLPTYRRHLSELTAKLNGHLGN